MQIFGLVKKAYKTMHYILVNNISLYLMAHWVPTVDRLNMNK